MEALGRTVNVISVADGVYISLRDCGGVAFSCYLAAAAGDTYTLVEAKDAAGTGAQNLAAVTRYYTCTGDGTDAWTKRTQAAAATVVTSATATQNAMWVEIDGAQLSDDYDYVKLTSTGAGRVEAIARDLVVQRAPANLPALGA
jgi:hypothetical protein